MIDYEQILTELREEKAACQYAYGEMVPVFYVQALRKAIKDIMDCRDCAAEAERMAREVQHKNNKRPPLKNPKKTTSQEIIFNFLHASIFLQIGIPIY